MFHNALVRRHCQTSARRRYTVGPVALGEPLEDGWPRCALSDCDYATIPGTALSLPLQRGVMFDVMQAFLRDMNDHIEPVMNSAGLADEGSWTPTNSVGTSNHLGGTAVDYNWRDHPMGPKAPDPAAGWNGSVLIAGDQVPAIRDLLAYYTTPEGIQLIWWGNDWTSPWDSMHFQYGYGTYTGQDAVKRWADAHIRADGYSTYRRGGQPRGGGAAVPPTASGGLTVAVLAQAMDYRVTNDRYAALLPHLIECFHLAGCDTVKRRAGMLGQLFAESGGLKYQREIASGAEYEGRADLGNTQPGDGVRFAGRDFIQITGRSNYTQLSAWAFSIGQVPTRTFFVDNPDQLATDAYAFLGVVWYWTQARPQLNALADAGDVEGMTRAVNGGLNGLADRQAAYSRALAAGTNLLDPADTDPILELLMSDATANSRSIYATPGEPPIKLSDLLINIDANQHRELVEQWAALGDTDSLNRIVRTANGQGQYTDTATVAHATAVLATIKATTPDIWSAYLTRIGAVTA